MSQFSVAKPSPPVAMRWSVPVTIRIALAIIALVCAALLLSSVLNFAKFQKTLNNLADEHYAFLLGDLHDSIEAGVAIGVPLSALHNIQDLVERERKSEPEIVAIQVADDFGRILYSTAPNQIGRTVPADWPAHDRPHRTWRITTANTVTLGEPVLNAFDGIVGTLTLTYSSAYYQAKGQQVLDTLLHDAFPLALFSMLVTLAGCLFLLRAFRRSMDAMSHDLESALAGRPVDRERPKSAGELERQLDAFLRMLAQATTGGGVITGTAAEIEETQSRRLLYPIFILTAFVILIPLALVSWQAVGVFETALVPEMHSKGAALARAVSKDVSRALDLRIPIDKLGGTRAYLAGMMALVPEASYIAIADGNGKLLYSGGLSIDAVKRVLHKGNPLPTAPDADYGMIQTADNVDITTIVPSPDPKSFGRGFIHVGISRKFIAAQTEDIIFNVGVMSLSGLLITFEILLLILALVVLHPLTLLRQLLGFANEGHLGVRARSIARSEVGRLMLLIQAGIDRIRAGAPPDRSAPRQEVHAANLVFMRTPLFLFCFAEEFARSFFPIYTNDLAEKIHGVSSTMLASLPITIFMLLTAILTPISAQWSDRGGRRPTFLIGVILSMLGMALTALAGNYWELLIYRALSGVGYAMVFIASQGYVLDNTSERDRARGMASYVAAITGADLAGPPIGGIVSDQLGFQASFIIAACFIALSAILAWTFMHDGEGTRVERPRLRRADIALLLENARFTGLIVCVSMPAKLLLAGFLFYLVPLHLSAIGANESAIGRVIMIYAICCIAFTPVAAHIADKWHRQQSVVIGGALIAGLSLIVLTVQNGMTGIIIAVAGLGVGQAFSLASQLSLVTRYAAEETEWLGRTTVISIFRLVERLGAVIGPLIAGALLITMGARDAIVILGLIATAGALSMIGILRFGSSGEGRAP